MNARKLALGGLILAIASSNANADNLSWNFQRTGFRTTLSTPQTALSMRSNLSWPVVYAIDQSSLNAYSLFPVPNATPPIGPATNWHQIGSNLSGSFVPSSGVYLQAASTAPDKFAVSLQTQIVSSIPTDFVAIGTSQGGFQSPMAGMQAVKFDADGDAFTASSSLIPGLTPNFKLFDVAISKFGEVGAVTQSSSGSGVLTFWQQSPLLAGKWISSPIDQSENDGALFGPSVDLTYDTSSGPHVVGVNRLGTNNEVAAHRFDVMTGDWTSSILDVASSGSPAIADVAAASNEAGIVGAAWVNFGALKYAYLDTNAPAPHWTVTTVTSVTPTGSPLELAQGVGLAYDKSGLPVISFVERSNRQIWVAYDPPLVNSVPITAGDFNRDGRVDGADLAQWQTGYGDGAVADANGDGRTDGDDLLAWQRNLAVPTNPSAATVPEPAATSLLIVAAASVVSASRRRRA